MTVLEKGTGHAHIQQSQLGCWLRQAMQVQLEGTPVANACIHCLHLPGMLALELVYSNRLYSFFRLGWLHTLQQTRSLADAHTAVVYCALRATSFVDVARWPAFPDACSL